MSANNNVSNPSYDEVEIDKQAKQQLVIQTITKHLSATSSHKIFRQIQQALDDGSSLSCKILSGGYTNYSYKVSVQGHHDLNLFAKLSFEYALWNPDKSSHYSLKRTENEWEIMMAVSEIAPGSVVKPLGCWDLCQDEQNMKLFVTEWSSADEQFCNQFIDGVVDSRIAPKLAETLASLHSIKDFDPEFNANVKPCMENMLEQMRVYVSEVCAHDMPRSRTEKYCVETGHDVLSKVIDGIIANYHQRDCLIHSDSHVFNILVESKPSIEELESFGPSGKMVLCDWEMAMAGPMGRDVGLAISFPIACYVAHALNGEVVQSIFEYITVLVDCYLDKMEEAAGITDSKKVVLYRNIIGWSGWFQFIALHWKKCQDSYPDKGNASNAAYVQDSMGLLGLMMMRFALDGDTQSNNSATLDDVKSAFTAMLRDEVHGAYKVATDEKRSSERSVKSRKSSILRIMDRRISDAMLNFGTVEACLDSLDITWKDDDLDCSDGRL